MPQNLTPAQIQQALTGIIGDLLLSAMDFEQAQEAARRLKRMVPAQALGTAPSQQEQMLQMQIQQLQATLAKVLSRNAKDQMKLIAKDQMRDIDVFKAETDRFKAFADAFGLDPEAVKGVLDELVQQSHQINLSPIVEANDSNIVTSSTGGSGGDAVPPGNSAFEQWALRDPTKMRGVMRLGPLAQEHKAAE